MRNSTIYFILAVVNLTSFSLWANEGYPSKMAMISHIHAAGFDHVIEVTVKDKNFTNYYKRDDQYIGGQSFYGYKKAYGRMRKPSLDYMKTVYGEPKHMMYAFQVGDSFICYTDSLETDHRTLYQKKFTDIENKNEIRGIDKCLIVPTGVSAVIKALEQTPEQKIIVNEIIEEP